MKIECRSRSLSASYNPSRSGTSVRRGNSLSHVSDDEDEDDDDDDDDDDEDEESGRTGFVAVNNGVAELILFGAELVDILTADDDFVRLDAKLTVPDDDSHTPCGPDTILGWSKP